MIDRLFTYGTLEIPAVFQAVALASRPSRPAVLEGYARFLVRGECFPGITERPGHATSGTLYFDLELEMLARIDRFEGREFERKTVDVSMAGERFSAYVYTVRSETLSDEPWDPKRFMERHLEEFLAARSAWIE